MKRKPTWMLHLPTDCPNSLTTSSLTGVWTLLQVKYLSFMFDSAPKKYINIHSLCPSLLYTRHGHRDSLIWQRNRKRSIHHFVFFLFIRFYLWIWPCELNMHLGIYILQNTDFSLCALWKQKFQSAWPQCRDFVSCRSISKPLTYLHIYKIHGQGLILVVINAFDISIIDIIETDIIPKRECSTIPVIYQCHVINFESTRRQCVML